MNYVELKVVCAECGKDMKVVTLEDSDVSDFLCPQCENGDIFSLREE